MFVFCFEYMNGGKFTILHRTYGFECNRMKYLLIIHICKKKIHQLILFILVYILLNLFEY